MLVTELVEGSSFEEVRKLDAEQRDRFGEIVFRFFNGSLYRNGFFSGDPHPGNYRLMDDGRVAFLDFGMTKQVSREHLAQEIAALRAVREDDADALHRTMAEMGYFDVDAAQIPKDRFIEHFRALTHWYVGGDELTVTSALVGQVVIDMGDPRSEYWDMARHGTMPPDALLARRMEMLVLGVLGQLEATADWSAIAAEWLFDEPPATPLGKLDAEFFGGQRSAA